MSPSRSGLPKRGANLEPFTARLTPDAKRRLLAVAQILDVNAYASSGASAEGWAARLAREKWAS